ncbi:MAG: hypothetical protein FWE57_02355 [Chitinispirillia bacterium]|nr:hypothetical protein [Chitinispirillia bacterium]
MQKLRQLIKLKSEKGSTIVGAVAICAVLSISIAGLMSVSRNTVNHEAEAHDDTKAFLAAESGLFMLTDWVARTGSQLTAGASAPMVFDGINVVVTTSLIQNNPDNTSRWRLSSTASIPAGGSGQPLPYEKTVEWVVDLEPIEVQSGAGGIVSQSSGGAGLQNQHFDGPAHFNEPLVLGNVNAGDGVKFRGPVTVHNPTNVGGGAPRFSTRPPFNNYTYGVIDPNNAPLSLGDLDQVFESSYRSDAEFRDLDIAPPAVASRTVLAVNNTSGVRNELTFGVTGGVPHYIFRTVANNGSGAELSTTGVIPYTRNVPILLSANGNLTIMPGVVLGVVTVETIGGHNIIINLINGNLTYDWAPNFQDSHFNNNDDRLNNAGVTAYDNAARGQPDVLAFYSDNNIILSNTNSGNAKRVITAQLYAFNEGGTFDMGSTNQTLLNLIGTASANTFWNLSGNQGNKIFAGVTHDKRELGAYAITVRDSGGNQLALQNKILQKIDWLETNN